MNGTQLNKTACSAFAAGKKATVNGRALNCYTSDGVSDFRLWYVPASDHAPGDVFNIEYSGIEGGFGHDARGSVPQTAHTYGYFNSEVPFANENGVFISENTCASKAEAASVSHEDALIDWHTLPELALARSKTAREAVRVMGGLVSAYALRGAAESFMVSDSEEVWVFEAVGDSTVWAAVRCPEDCVVFHANRLRIGKLNPGDGENCICSENVISHALEKGLYRPEDGEFSFEKVYSSNRDSMNCIRREWRASDLICPSRKFMSNAIGYPLFLRPEIDIDMKWVTDVLWRDALEGTRFDPTACAAAGPYACPERQKIKGASGMSRIISTCRIAYATVCEARDDGLPGLIMFSADTPRNGTYIPLYTSQRRVGEEWSKGSYLKAEEGAYWAFQKLDTLSRVRYKDMHAFIRNAFDPFEAETRSELETAETEALKLIRQGRGDEARARLEEICLERGDKALSLARETLDRLFAAFRDGDPEGEAGAEWQALYAEADEPEKADPNLEYK